MHHTITRFAPSPTGYIHLGNVRTALFSYLYAQKTQNASDSNQNQFVLRIEDSDAERSREAYVDALKADLAWLGIHWSPTVWKQSERAEIYDQYYQQLWDKNLAYACFCTPEELELQRRLQQAAGRPPRYDGQWAKTPRAEQDRLIAEGKPYALRMRVPNTGEIVFEDGVKGLQKFKAADIGDFIIRRTDGSPAFFFCNAIDDSLGGITHVLRGEDHLSNTPRQQVILEALGLRVPRYAHLPMIQGAEGTVLSKRLGSLSIRALRADGWQPLALVNYLARLGHHYANENFLNIDELAREFDLSHIGQSAARFDLVQLEFRQQQALSLLSDDDLCAQWAEILENIPENLRLGFVHLVRPNVLLNAQVGEWAARLLHVSAEKPENWAELGIDPQFFAKILANFENIFEKNIKNNGKLILENIKNTTQAKGKNLFMPLRLALTGTAHGPDLAGILAFLPVEILQAKFEAAAAWA